MDRARLGAFVERLGAAVAAQRFGVTRATVSRWLKSGVSRAAESAVAKKVTASEARVKAAATRREHKKQTKDLGYVGGQEFILPPRQRQGQNLTPDQLTPRIDPRVDGKSRQLRSKHHHDWEEIDSERYEGKSKWFVVDQRYYQGFDQQLGAWSQLVSDEWKRSGLRFARVRALVAIHYPYNPAYKDSPSLMRKRGRWQHVYVQTRLADTDASVASLIDMTFLHSRAKKGRLPGEASIDAQSETRLVWVHELEILLTNSRGPEPTARQLLDAPINPANERRKRARRRSKK